MKRRCHACDQDREDVGELPDSLPLCAQCAKAHRMGYRCGEEAATLWPPTPPARVFEGILLAPDTTGRATWLLEDLTDATKESGDEAWFAWAEGKHVRVTVERMSGFLSRPDIDRVRRERFELMSAVVAKAGGEVRLTDCDLTTACGYHLERTDHAMGGITLRVVVPRSRADERGSPCPECEGQGTKNIALEQSLTCAACGGRGHLGKLRVTAPSSGKEQP